MAAIEIAPQYQHEIPEEVQAAQEAVAARRSGHLALVGTIIDRPTEARPAVAEHVFSRPIVREMPRPQAISGGSAW